jgi:hypothetical protein
VNRVGTKHEGFVDERLEFAPSHLRQRAGRVASSDGGNKLGATALRDDPAKAPASKIMGTMACPSMAAIMTICRRTTLTNVIGRC